MAPAHHSHRHSSTHDRENVRPLLEAEHPDGHAERKRHKSEGHMRRREARRSESVVGHEPVSVLVVHAKNDAKKALGAIEALLYRSAKNKSEFMKRRRCLDKLLLDPHG